MRSLAREMRFLRERQARGGGAGGGGTADVPGPLSGEAAEAMQSQLENIAERSAERFFAQLTGLGKRRFLKQLAAK